MTQDQVLEHPLGLPVVALEINVFPSHLTANFFPLPLAIPQKLLLLKVQAHALVVEEEEHTALCGFARES
jgi:hypothetical protein